MPCVRSALLGAWLALLVPSNAPAADQSKSTQCGRNEDRAACLREDRAARSGARRGQLDDGLAEFRKNALLRCGYLPAEDRPDCERRMRGEGSVSGSVEAGGIYRELRTEEPSAAK